MLHTTICQILFHLRWFSKQSTKFSYHQSFPWYNIHIWELAEKWLKDSGSKQAVLDAVVKEQFMEVLLDDVRVWVKEWKPRTSEEAGKLAEDYRQALKAEL